MATAAEFGGLTDSNEDTQDCRFNRRLWDRVVDDEASDDEDTPYKLVLKRGIRPSAAVIDLFSDLGNWAFDCGEAIQLLRWYAKLAATGPSIFNAHVVGRRFELKEHDSTGLTSTHVYLRIDGEGGYDKNVGFRLEALDEVVAASTEILLANAPIGSRIMWRNFDSRVDRNADFKNENALKRGSDAYFAHPMGFKNEKKLIRELAQAADQSLSDEDADSYAARHIRIVDIEYYSDV